ncbi:hypothetical protein DUNSADRAFT_12913 [Dunaliella salina]|uniref:Encoded protein n=1 Tax=Dunaliella salina TaxID=3046 RepID=A0ABQ7GAH5_DUNSA|nr:hypothetical protein DUNSADRAFT_12913 [Dunaliella salina]|eukprot:KAF5831601.1 hypothetical protein DUNSADRAFT_12913 [Dunaliella salina]
MLGGVCCVAPFLPRVAALEAINTALCGGGSWVVEGDCGGKGLDKAEGGGRSLCLAALCTEAAALPPSTRQSARQQRTHRCDKLHINHAQAKPSPCSGSATGHDGWAHPSPVLLSCWLKGTSSNASPSVCPGRLEPLSAGTPSFQFKTRWRSSCQLINEKANEEKQSCRKPVGKHAKMNNLALLKGWSLTQMVSDVPTNGYPLGLS